jgi:hypothetical protein
VSIIICVLFVVIINFPVQTELVMNLLNQTVHCFSYVFLVTVLPVRRHPLLARCLFDRVMEIFEKHVFQHLINSEPFVGIKKQYALH